MIINTEQLKRCIQHNFPINNPPKEVIKSNTLQYSLCGAATTRTLLEGKNWLDIDFSQVDNDIWHCFSVITEEAFQYYLPSFLSYFIDEKDQHGLLLDDFIENNLNPRNHFSQQRFDFLLSFDNQKGKIVLDFLNLMIERNQSRFLAEIAIEDFWSIFKSV